MNKSSIVNFLDGRQHLDQQLNGYLEAVIGLQHLPDLCQVATEQIHDNQVSLAIFDEIMYIAHMLESPELG